LHRALVYAGLVVAAIAVHLALRQVTWERSSELHMLMEVAACLVALMVTKIALVRYYSRPTDRFLLLGVAFLGTGLLDGYHALAGTGLLGDSSRGLEMAAQSWGWLASRLYLATLVVVTIFIVRIRPQTGKHLDQRLVFGGAALLFLTFLGLLSLAPLSGSYASDLWLRRLLELIPAAAFLAMLVYILRRGDWRSGTYDHWLVLSLLVAFLGQALFMGFARGPLDPLVVAGHVAKVLGYLCILFGLLGDIYALFRRSDRVATELTRINAALQAEAHERTRAEQDRDHFFDLSLDLLCIGGLDGFFRQLNPAWESVLGWSVEELKMKPFLEFIHPDDRDRAAGELQRLRLGGMVVDFECRLQAKDGTYRWLSWRSAPLPGKGLFYGAARDISERKHVEQMKDDFVSVVSHELRTPLTSIRGSLGLLAGGVAGALPERAGVLLDIAAKNSERLVRLINDILDIEKIESGEMGFRLIPQDLMLLVEQAVESNQTYGQPYGIALRIVESVSGVRVRADADRIQQVLTNLLSNAVKFSPREGVVEVGVMAGRGRALIRVSDHGKGIPPGFRSRIFEKFAQADATSTRQQGGTGLGLTISKAIVERHGGRIWFETVEDEGTTFFVELPEWLADPAVDVEPERSRILVCEDDPDVAHLLVMMLEQGGFEADVAADAAEARRLLAERDYAAMTLDLILPDQDGVSLLRELREDAAGRQMPVVVVSARAEQGRRELNGGAIGVIDWLVKPIDQERLQEALRRAVRPVDGGDPADRPTILHVEDDADLREVVGAIIEQAADVERAQDLAEARAQLARRRFDLVILDLALPDGSGMDLLPLLGSLSPPTPVIIFSAHEVDSPVASRVASVLVKSQTSNRELVEKIQSVLGR
jgi:PAS domain S-box-containing protein